MGLAIKALTIVVLAGAVGVAFGRLKSTDATPPRLLDSGGPLSLSEHRPVEVRLEPDRWGLRAVLSLHNPTDQAIVVGRISRSCGCLGACVESKRIGVTGTTPLTLELGRSHVREKAGKRFLVTVPWRAEDGSGPKRQTQIIVSCPASPGP